MTITEEKEARIYIAKLEKENEIMKKLSTRLGFYTLYFDSLKCCSTKELAFEKVNNLYTEMFGFKRYESYLHFQELKLK